MFEQQEYINRLERLLNEAAIDRDMFRTALAAIAKEQSSPNATLMADQFQQIARDALNR